MSNKGDTKIKGVIDTADGDKEDMFIGWAPAPSVDRRFLLGAMPLALAGTTGLSWLVASELDDPGAGAWLTNATHKVTGVLTRDPYPMIRFADPDAPFGIRTVLIVAQGKCTSALKLADVDGGTFTASGALIQRKDRQMLEVPPFLEDWLEPAETPESIANLYQPTTENIGSLSLEGFIMDSKCFFGVMKPARGKTHKACASLCIRGGIPPSFWARSSDGRESIMLMTDSNGDPLGEDILPLVADPVSVTGEVIRVGDLLQLRANASDFRRI